VELQNICTICVNRWRLACCPTQFLRSDAQMGLGCKNARQDVYLLIIIIIIRGRGVRNESSDMEVQFKVSHDSSMRTDLGRV
jgi:hypothetical protein